MAFPFTTKSSRGRRIPVGRLVLAAYCYYTHTACSAAFFESCLESLFFKRKRPQSWLTSSGTTTKSNYKAWRRDNDLFAVALLSNSRKSAVDENATTKQDSVETHSTHYMDVNILSRVTDKDHLKENCTPKNSAAVCNNVLDTTTTTAPNSTTKNAPVDKSTNHVPTITATVQDHPAKVVPTSGFNVVLTHCTADFDSLASAVGLAKLWSFSHPNDTNHDSSSKNLPTFVVLPRGAHPAVHRFLALHKHLFPIRSLRSLPSDLSNLNRLGLVDAQRRDRIGPAEHLLSYAKHVTVLDHHIDSETDIPEATDYEVDEVGSVTTMVVERIRLAGIPVSEAEATLFALGIHADTGSLVYDCTTARDAEALAWVMGPNGRASQAAIAEHAQSCLSMEQQGVLTQALTNTNTTLVHGVTVSTVLLSAEGFINGLAAVTQDALELSSSDVFILAVVYDAKGKGKKSSVSSESHRLLSKLWKNDAAKKKAEFVMQAEAWKGGDVAFRRRRLRAAFDKKDTDGSGFLGKDDLATALASSGIVATVCAIDSLMASIDKNRDGQVDFKEFVMIADEAELRQKEEESATGRRATTMIIIGRVKAGVNMKSVNLNCLFQQFGGGGHPKASSCTVRLGDESEAGDILQGLVDELIETSLMKQATVGDFMTSPVLSAKPQMTEKQVGHLFTRYDVRALPVVDDNNDVIGLVTYKEVAAAQQRLWNKEQKLLRREARENAAATTAPGPEDIVPDLKHYEPNSKKAEDRKLGSALKGWMKQHIQTVDASRTMSEVEAILLENDIGCIPVVADGTKQLVGMVTRTDLLRQHRYYPSLHYHNKGFSDSIAARKPIIELRRKLKKFDLEE